MSQFVLTRTLLNSRFEGYKLSFSPPPYIHHIPLGHWATQSRSGIDARGFQDVASRVRHNHLAVGDDGAMYVAEDGSVVLVRMDEEKLNVSDEQDGFSLHVVFQLPQPSRRAQEHVEYPAAAFLSPDTWLVHDGHGVAYLLHITNPNSTAHMLASWQLHVYNSSSPCPFQLHGVTTISPGLALAVLSSPSPSTVSSSSSSDKTQRMFDIWAVRIPLSDPSPSPMHSSPSPFDISWCRRGSHIPYFATYIPSQAAYLLIGGSSYDDITSATVHPYEPALDEIVTIPRVGETLDIPPAIVPPYSWTQTDDTVTLGFALPGLTPKSSIHITFERVTFSLRIGSPPLPHPFFEGAVLWDTIHPTSSLWTWERGRATCAGLLTVHLDKAHPGTRWSHVFSQESQGNEVAETLDPSELAEIRDALDKYTASLQCGSSELGHGVPSLTEGERDNEVDTSVGRSIILTWISNDGNVIGPRDDTPAVLLSLPFPGVKDTLSLVIKNDIDGPLYTFDGGGWNHTATYPALGFVLASKRDTRFTFHLSSTAVLAFESGARYNGGGNVYIYRGSAPGDKWAKQGVFRQQTDAGALLGVGAVTSKAGDRVILCLCERELTICRGLS